MDEASLGEVIDEVMLVLEPIIESPDGDEAKS